MSAQPTLRPLGRDDADDAWAVLRAAADARTRAEGREPDDIDEERRARMVRRIARFTRTDPAGAWGAEVDGDLVGIGVAIRREDLWGLALLFVHPDHQSSGIGRRLLERTRDTAEGARVEVIQSSDDPRAIRRYAGLGLRLHPAVGVKGDVDRASLPAGLPVRDADESDLDLVDDVDRRLRGAPRTADVADLIADDAELRVVDRAGGRGFAVSNKGGVVVLGADDEDTARDLLWAVLATADDGFESWGWTATQHWAIEVALAARLKVKPGGTMFLRGLPAFPGPYLPSGVYF